MKSNVTLIPVVHDESLGIFVHPSLQIHLGPILEQMSPRTALCIEGIKPKVGVRIGPDHPRYSSLILRLWPTLVHNKTFPRVPLYGAEPRSKTGSQESSMFGFRLRMYLDFLDIHLFIPDPPQTIEDALARVRCGDNTYGFSKPPNLQLAEIARDVHEMEVTWLKDYSRLAEFLLRNNDEVLIIAGVAHIIGLHLQNDWPIKWLNAEDSIILPEMVYRSYMNLHGFAEKIISCAM